MGIFNSIANEAQRNFIARPDSARGDIIYKYPEKNVRMMTKLNLNPDEMAIFVNEGRIAGKLGPGGTYTLDSKNIPFIGALIEKVTGGNLFVAEIYFVSTNEVTGVRFGGPLGSVTDPVTQMMVDAKVFGDFSAQVTDPEKLIFGTVGSGTQLQSNNAFLDWFKGILLKHLSDAIGELGEKGWSLNKMISPANKIELQGAVLQQIRPEVERHGLKINALGNFVVSIDEEAKAELNKRNMAIADDQRRMALAKDSAYMTVAQAETMRNAGIGMSKGGEGSSGALAGMGLGMGLQMAQVMGQQMHPGQAAQAPAMVKCPACGSASAPGKFCNACGKPLAAVGPRCECGAELAPGSKFCSSCGKPAGPKKCECGVELAPGAKFCSGCGKPA